MCGWLAGLSLSSRDGTVGGFWRPCSRSGDLQRDSPGGPLRGPGGGGWVFSWFFFFFFFYLSFLSRKLAKLTVIFIFNLFLPLCILTCRRAGDEHERLVYLDDTNVCICMLCHLPCTNPPYAGGSRETWRARRRAAVVPIERSCMMSGHQRSSQDP